MTQFRHRFVNDVPDRLEPGVLYVSLENDTVLHLCACGCGNETVTPLAPTEWRMSYDGESISLHPSIGNWSFDCQSHYFITNGVVRWARKWSKDEIARGRAYDRALKDAHYNAKTDTASLPVVEPVAVQVPDKRGFRAWLARLFRN